jgi:hypothetical protein
LSSDPRTSSQPDEFAPPDPCDHANAYVLTQEEFATISEGSCAACKVPAHVVDGWSVCPCCDAAWQVTRDHLIARLSYSVEPLLSGSIPISSERR